jgi:hypothetical protein
VTATNPIRPSALARLRCSGDVASAHALPALALVDPELAVPESVFAGIVATAVAVVCGRFPG